jgi:hypothetical protein
MPRLPARLAQDVCDVGGNEPAPFGATIRAWRFTGVHHGSQTGIEKPISPLLYSGELSRIRRWCMTGVLAACLAGFEPATGGLEVPSGRFYSILQR